MVYNILFRSGPDRVGFLKISPLILDIKQKDRLVSVVDLGQKIKERLVTRRLYVDNTEHMYQIVSFAAKKL